MNAPNSIFQGKNIWMYWPEDNAKLFDENFEKDQITCQPKQGTFGDLTPLLNSTKGFERALFDSYARILKISNSKDLLLDLCVHMKMGDFVLARSSVKAIVGIGIVTGDYYFDNSRASENHCRAVKWLASGCWSFEGFQKRGWHRVTLVKGYNRQVAEQLITKVCGSLLTSIETASSENNPSTFTLDKNGQHLGSKNADNIINDKQVDNNPTADYSIQKDNLSEAYFSKDYYDSPFKAKAREHQRKWFRKLADKLGVQNILEEHQGKAVLLRDEYALQGFIFCPLFRKDFFALYKDDVPSKKMGMLKNTLRSEHIPYNLIFPMIKEENWDKIPGFLNQLLGIDTIAEALDMDIEFSPEPKEKYLDDHTAFDIYIKYRHIDGTIGGIGIEVKYTEEAYTIRNDSKEYKCTHDVNGALCLCPHYRKATDRSGYYRDNVDKELVTDPLRQIWRNHILGASMVDNGDLSHFTSVTIYPSGNVHFHEVEKQYRSLLTTDGNESFKMVTYEEFFSLLTLHFRDELCLKWISYLYDRYLFDTEHPDILKDVDYYELFDDTYGYYVFEEAEQNPIRYRYSLHLTKSLNRGLKANLIEAFKRSPLYKLYQDHSDELIICVRRDYLNLYHRRNSIAKVSLSQYGEIKAEIDPYFLEINGSQTITLKGNQIQEKIVDRFERIKHLTQNKKYSTYEFIAQQMLFMQNNSNPGSKWYCVDLEWARCFSCEEEKLKSGLKAKIDIIAITKEAPHRVAIIELKYGISAISGDSDVVKHIEDFRKFQKGYTFEGERKDNYKMLVQDICNILQNYKELGIKVPESLQNITAEDFAQSPEFFILTLDNNQKQTNANLPKKTMGAYLFSPNSRHFLEWECKRPAKENVMQRLGFDVLNARSPLRVTFIFSKMDITNLNIKDILEDPSYEIIRPHL